MRIASDYDTELHSTNIRKNLYDVVLSSGTTTSRDIVEHMTSELTTLAPSELPDGKIITVGDESFCCAEVLFQPSFIGEEAGDPSFPDVTKCDVDLRKNLYANVVLSCGTNIFQGMIKRIIFELTASSLSTMRSRWLLHRKLHHCWRYSFPLR